MKPLDLEEFRWDGSEFGEEYHSYPTEAEREIVYAVTNTAVKFHNGDIDKIKQRLKSACEFYLRYKDRPALLAKEIPKYRKEVEKFGEREALFPVLHRTYEWDFKKYNKWLFKLAFKGVME